MTDGRRDEPWWRQAARGVGFVILIGVLVFAAGAVIAAVFTLAIR